MNILAAQTRELRRALINDAHWWLAEVREGRRKAEDAKQFVEADIRGVVECNRWL
jgi:hypothetical protein